MKRRRTMLIATAGRVLAVALTALTMPPCLVRAEASCSTGSKAAYGACYKHSLDRTKCQVQLQRCLEGCICSKR